MNVPDIFSLDFTLSMLPAIQQIEEPIGFLTQTFFPNKMTVPTDFVGIEYQKKLRRLAPFVTRDFIRGVNMTRDTSEVKWYRPVMVAPRRVISTGDVNRRLFGEMPNIYGAPTVEERQARLQAEDMADLMRMIENRKNAMASEILQNGKITVKQYSDDGVIVATDDIDFECNNQITPTISWNNPNAKIFENLKAVSEKIQTDLGEIPTVAICGKNIEKYLLANTEIKDWLMLPNRENLTMASFSPHFTSPQVRFIGYISALNLEFVSYSQTYTGEDGTTKYFVEPDNVIIGLHGKGRQIYSPVTIFNNGNFQTISAPVIPHYTHNDDAQTASLTLYSRFILTPDYLNSWRCLKTCG